MIADAEHLFITTNKTLARIASKFHKKNYEALSIPPSSTDLFMGTLIWLKSPAKVEKIKYPKIIADCYAALQPDKRLINIYIGKINELKKDQSIKEDDYYLLRGRVAINILEENTLGDVNNFSDSTANEILEKIKNGIQGEITQKYEKEKDEYITKENQIENELGEKKSIIVKIEKFLEIIVSVVSWIIFLIALIVVIVISYHSFRNPNILWIILAIILAIVDFIYGINLNGMRGRVKKLLMVKVKKCFGIK
jgi:hypothetical protein